MPFGGMLQWGWEGRQGLRLVGQAPGWAKGVKGQRQGLGADGVGVLGPGAR